MVNLHEMQHLLLQWVQLSCLVGALSLVNTWFGIGLSFFCLPNWLKLRCWLIAPIVGTALQVVALTPASFFGVSVSSASAPLFFLSAIVNGIAFIVIFKSPSRIQIFKKSLGLLKEEGIYWLILLGVLTFICTALVTGMGAGAISDVWGSGDFLCYWTHVDYLRSFGGRLDFYLAQDVFSNEIILTHLTNRSRLGSMVYVAFSGNWLTGLNLHRVIFPVIVSAMWTSVVLVSCLLLRQGLKSKWFFFVVVCHPFLYFLLFFSYVGQSVSMPIMLLAIFCFDAKKYLKVWYGLAVSILVGASLLSYPVAVPILGLFYACQVCGIWRKEGRVKRLSFLAIHLLGALFLSWYYLPNVIVELLDTAKQNPMDGWPWRSVFPIGFGELLGTHTVLGYHLPEQGLNNPFRLLREILFAVVTLPLLVYGCKGLRSRGIYLSLFICVSFVGCITLYKVGSGVGNATHGVVKLMSQYYILFLIPVLVGLNRWFYKKAQMWRRVIQGGIFVWILAEVCAVGYGVQQKPWYTSDLIALAKRHNTTNQSYALIMNQSLSWRKKAAYPLIQNDKQLMDFSHKEIFQMMDASSNTLFFVDRKFAWMEESAIFDQKGRYAVGYPPSTLMFSEWRHASWIVNGNTQLSPASPSLTAIMSSKGGLLKVFVSRNADVAPLSLQINVNGRFFESLTLDSVEGRFDVQLPREVTSVGGAFRMITVSLIGLDALSSKTVLDVKGLSLQDEQSL